MTRILVRRWRLTLGKSMSQATSARQSFGEEAFFPAWAEGRGMLMEHAIDLALGA